MAATAIEPSIVNGGGRIRKMEEFVKMFTRGLPLRPNFAFEQGSNPIVVLMVGSTGTMGPYILHSLLNTTAVHKVICLSRSANGRQRQVAAAETYGLDSHALNRVEFHRADICAPHLGLSYELYDQLASEVTHIVHNAWTVHFNKPLEAFSNIIGSVRHFIDLACASTNNAQLFFMSSIDVTRGSVRPGQRVPEGIIEDWSSPSETGYSQSKFVTERIMDEAAKRSGVRTTVCRVGQIAGPSGRLGVWTETQWVPRLIAGSYAMKKLPANLGSQDAITWIPVDLLGTIVAEVVLSSGSSDVCTPLLGANVLHIANPLTVSWNALVPSIARFMPPDVEVLPYEQWVEALKAVASAPKSMTTPNPALKLVGFYDGLRLQEGAALSVLDVTNAARSSDTLKNLCAINEKLMENWMRQWGFNKTVRLERL